MPVPDGFNLMMNASPLPPEFDIVNVLGKFTGQVSPTT
jgi:hypothetical protein